MNIHFYTFCHERSNLSILLLISGGEMYESVYSIIKKIVIVFVSRYNNFISISFDFTKYIETHFVLFSSRMTSLSSLLLYMKVTMILVRIHINLQIPNIIVVKYTPLWIKLRGKEEFLFECKLQTGSYFQSRFLLRSKVFNLQF